MEISGIKLLSLPSVRGVDFQIINMNLIENFQGKRNFNFQRIKLIFNSIFYKELKEYTFVEISRIKLLSEPSARGLVDTKG